ncbi:MAG: 50S ribosomal protein L10 [Dehalococcoidia bacterium]
MVRKEKKPEIVDRISDKLNRAEVVVATDYRGLTVAQITDLRSKLRKQGVEYHVVKNTLAGFAAGKVGKADLAQYLEGPTAIAFGYDDPVQALKVLLEYQKSAEDIPLQIKGGLLGNELLTAQQVSAIAKLPPRDELIAKLAGTLQAPISGLINVLNGNLQGLVTVLQARVKQLEEGV